jgi:hypothetical protein
MFKKTFTYKDYKRVERTEDHYFNLNKAELVEMEMSTKGGYTEMLQRIVKASDMPTLFKTFKDFIFKSYGEKSADGKYFNKIDRETGRPLVEAFAETEAYSILMEQLVTDSKFASDFVNAVITGSTTPNIPANTAN